MEIKVLGPLELRHGGRPATPSAGKPRQVLALLALQVGHTVTTPTLKEELWGPRPPRSAGGILQTYVLQLRRQIQAVLDPSDGRVAKDVLRTTDTGYLLDGPGCEVDVRIYTRLVATGQHLLDAGDFGAAARLLRSALDVWSGPVLVDVTAGMRLDMEIVQLNDGRLKVELLHAEAELRVGRHFPVLGDLRVLAARHPADERPAALLMLALHRSGQQWRALKTFADLRAQLVAEFGKEPSARLQLLHQAILNSDPALDDPEGITRYLTP